MLCWRLLLVPFCTAVAKVAIFFGTCKCSRFFFLFNIGTDGGERVGNGKWLFPIRFYLFTSYIYILPFIRFGVFVLLTSFFLWRRSLSALCRFPFNPSAPKVHHLVTHFVEYCRRLEASLARTTIDGNSLGVGQGGCRSLFEVVLLFMASNQ